MMYDPMIAAGSGFPATGNIPVSTMVIVAVAAGIVLVAAFVAGIFTKKKK